MAADRTATVTGAAPVSRKAPRAEQAVAPPPRMSAFPSALTPAWRNAVTMPPTSVLKPRRCCPANTTVFAAPTSAASGSAWSSSGSTARFSGIVSDRPAQPRPE